MDQENSPIFLWIKMDLEIESRKLFFHFGNFFNRICISFYFQKLVIHKNNLNRNPNYDWILRPATISYLVKVPIVFGLEK